MSKIRVLSDQLANQIAAGEVVERPASVAKEIVENSIDAGATRIEVTIEAGGRRLLRVVDDGSGMSRDDAVLAFERHATSKISTVGDLDAIKTLGFRGEALASIASVARVELTTHTEDEPEATRVVIEGGRLRDVAPAAHPRGTSFTMRDLFFNIPARRKFLRSEATESYHLTNLVTHYALAHPEIEFSLTNNGRESLHATRASDLRERAYQIFGADFVSNLLEVESNASSLIKLKGYTSAPRERRTSTDAQFLFVNGRFIRDKLIRRALMEGYKSVLPHGVYPAALLFLEVPFDEVDVNVHPAKTEVRFRRAAAISDAVRESIRAALARAGFVREAETSFVEPDFSSQTDANNDATQAHGDAASLEDDYIAAAQKRIAFTPTYADNDSEIFNVTDATRIALNRSAQDLTDVKDLEASETAAPFADNEASETPDTSDQRNDAIAGNAPTSFAENALASSSQISNHETPAARLEQREQATPTDNLSLENFIVRQQATAPRAILPPVDSAAHLVREIAVETLTTDIRPLGQLAESYIIATDNEGLLLIDQHVAHERILFDKYRSLESSRTTDSQQMLIPETFDLSPAQATAFDAVQDELESYGFGLMRLSGRTVAVRAVPADLPIAEARNLLIEVLETIDAEKRGRAKEGLRDRIAASLACRAAVKINMPLSIEKMQWLIDKLLTTSSPTTCPHGRPVILRVTMRDILKGFHRT